VRFDDGFDQLASLVKKNLKDSTHCHIAIRVDSINVAH
jgi:hypothetical protein